MSDPTDPDDFDVVTEPPLDWRDRLGAACESAGISFATLVMGAAALVAVLVAGLALFWPAADTGSGVEAALPFTRSPAEISTTTTESPDVIVHVAGAVARPGVYTLPAGGRVVDAIDAAGGATAAADLSRTNLAAAVTDGQQVYVLALGEDPPPPLTGGESGGTVDETASALVDLNTATVTELETLPGIGPALAAAIVSHRDENGPFAAVEALIDVPGIGEAKLAALRDLVTV